MAENSGSENTEVAEQPQPLRVRYLCGACGEITTRKFTELPPEKCWLCRAPMFTRPIPEEGAKQA